MPNNKCKECGFVCNKCATNHDVHLHVEIENLKQRLVERDNHIVTMETTFLNEANKYPNGEYVALTEELLTWQDKYSRLYEAHKRVQKVNQSLEDKLLKLVDKSETEKSTLTKDVATLSHRLADANYTIQRLQGDNEKYKNDVNLAIQLLQCKPGNFVSHRLDSLPNEVQAKVSSYVASRRKPPEDKKTPSEVRSIKVPIPTFPPTAMVYSIPKSSSPEDTTNTNDIDRSQVDIVSAAIMVKILEEREKERSVTKHCDSCTCSKNTLPSLVNPSTQHTVATQTGSQKTSLCLRCNNDVERSPLGRMKIVKSTSDLTAVPKSNGNSEVKNTFYYDANERDKHISHKVAVSENSKIVVNAISNSFVKSTVKTSIDPKSGHHRLCDHNAQPILTIQEEEETAVVENDRDIARCEYKVDRRIYFWIIFTNSSRTGSTSSDERKSLQLSECDNSYHKQQRVAEWVQNIDEHDEEASNSEHSRTERLTDFDPQHYAQIENNVKNFLFKNDLVTSIDNNMADGKHRKKLSNLKQNYRSLTQTDGTGSEHKSVQVVHTETQI
ncbi:uncharacterized protein CBL_02827 [Carabus blaptoides fortunei]